MRHQDSWFWTRRAVMKLSVAGVLLAGYRLLWPSASQAGSPPTTATRSDHEVVDHGETDPFGVSGLGESGRRKSRLGLELCPGRSEPGS